MINIALDGPSGAGKSTIAKNIAKILNIRYLDTGAMYRALAYKAKISNIDVNDKEAVEEMLKKIALDVKYINDDMKIYVDGIDVSDYIRENYISKMASDISKLFAVRTKLVDAQRKIAKENDLILDGRDIGSNVLPETKYKFYLTASVDERARRRHEDLKLRGQNVDIETVKKEIEDRDYNDTHREFAPLICCDDAILIDSSDLSIEETTECIIKKIVEIQNSEKN